MTEEAIEVEEIDETGAPIPAPAANGHAPGESLGKLLDSFRADEGSSDFLRNILAAGEMQKDMASTLATLATFTESLNATKAAVGKLGERDGQIEAHGQALAQVVAAIDRVDARAAAQAAVMQSIADVQSQQANIFREMAERMMASLADSAKVMAEMHAAFRELPKAMRPPKAASRKPMKYAVNRGLDGLVTTVEELE